MRDQAENLVLAVIEALEGDEESIMVWHLMKLRRSLANNKAAR